MTPPVFSRRTPRRAASNRLAEVRARTGEPAVDLTVSIGVATTVPTATQPAKDLIARADTALYEAKYPKAADCLHKDREHLLTFYDFPAEHWRHIRTTNPIESTFATVRLRTAKVRSCFSSTTVLTMAFKLCQSAQKRWIRLHHPERLAEVIKGVKFVDGIMEQRIAA